MGRQSQSLEKIQKRLSCFAQWKKPLQITLLGWEVYFLSMICNCLEHAQTPDSYMNNADQVLGWIFHTGVKSCGTTWVINPVEQLLILSWIPNTSGPSHPGAKDLPLDKTLKPYPLRVFKMKSLKGNSAWVEALLFSQQYLTGDIQIQRLQHATTSSCFTQSTQSSAAPSSKQCSSEKHAHLVTVIQRAISWYLNTSTITTKPL